MEEIKKFIKSNPELINHRSDWIKTTCKKDGHPNC
jgi:hypothetical protein